MASLRVQLGPNVVVPFGAALVDGADAVGSELPGTGDDRSRLSRGTDRRCVGLWRPNEMAATFADCRQSAIAFARVAHSLMRRTIGASPCNQSFP